MKIKFKGVNYDVPWNWAQGGGNPLQARVNAVGEARAVKMLDDSARAYFYGLCQRKEWKDKPPAEIQVMLNEAWIEPLQTQAELSFKQVAPQLDAMSPEERKAFATLVAKRLQAEKGEG